MEKDNVAVQNKRYTKEQLLGVIEGYGKMIERSGMEYPTVVLDDIRKSIGYVLEQNKGDKTIGFELSDSKRVAFVQERLGCNMKDAIAFIHEFHVIEEKEFDANYATGLLSDFSEDIRKAGLRVVDLTEDELAEIGRKVQKSFDDTMWFHAPPVDTRDVCDYVIKLLREQQHKVGELLADANARVADNSVQKSTAEQVKD